MASDPRDFASTAVRETLGQSSDVESCVTLASRIDALTAQAFDYFERDNAGIACRSGCNFCCHLQVMVFPHEAIALFRYLGSRMPKEQANAVKQGVLANAKEVADRLREGGRAAGIPCAFLVDGKCSAYEARPGACSGYHSLSRDACEQEYRAGAGVSDAIPMLQGLRHIAASLDAGMDAALAECGLSADRMELHTAVAALIRNPALIARWRSGRALLKP